MQSASNDAGASQAALASRQYLGLSIRGPGLSSCAENAYRDTALLKQLVSAWIQGLSLLGWNPSSVSMGYSQLNGVFSYLLVADESPCHPWWGCRRLGELFGLWEAGGGACLPHGEHRCFVSRWLLPAAGSRDASFNTWQLCSPTHSSELYTLLLWKLLDSFLGLVKHLCLWAGAGCLLMLAAGNGHFTAGHSECRDGTGTTEAYPPARRVGKSAGMC